MKEFKYYKQLIGAIILAGIMIMMALRISDIASGLDAIFTALFRSLWVLVLLSYWIF